MTLTQLLNYDLGIQFDLRFYTVWLWNSVPKGGHPVLKEHCFTVSIIPFSQGLAATLSVSKTVGNFKRCREKQSQKNLETRMTASVLKQDPNTD